MNNLNLELIKFFNFNSGWSLSPHELYICFKYLHFNDTLNILEFGSGDGTNKLVDLMNINNIKFYYKSFEHDMNYATAKHVDYVIYDENNIFNIDIDSDKKFDLVLIDGPHGNKRSIWYKKIKNNIRNGTILLIDDYHHYDDFEKELNKNFIYDNIITFNQNPSFIVINDGIEKIDLSIKNLPDKSFKIIKIKETI